MIDWSEPPAQRDDFGECIQLARANFEAASVHATSLSGVKSRNSGGMQSGTPDSCSKRAASSWVPLCARRTCRRTPGSNSSRFGGRCRTPSTGARACETLKLRRYGVLRSTRPGYMIRQPVQDTEYRIVAL